MKTPLSLLASAAAVELDNVCLERPTTLDAVNAVRERVSALLDAQGIVANDLLFRTLREHEKLLASDCTEADDLLRAARHFVGRFLLAIAGSSTLNDVALLRDACVTLSKQASIGPTRLTA